MERDKPQSTPDDAFASAITAYGTAMAQGNVEQVESAAMAAFSLAAEWAEKNPSPDLALMNEATACENRGDWAGAESRYHKLTAMAEASADFPRLTQARLKLCRLFLLLGRLDAAGECASAASTAARSTGLTTLRVMALETQALCALRRSDLAEALQAATEAVGLVETGPEHDYLRAGALVSRARCLAALGDEAGSERDLAASKPVLLERELSPILAGVHGKVASWWEAAAALCTLRGDAAGAEEHWSRAVERRRHIASLCHVAGPHTLSSLARTLAGQGEALEAAGRSAEAKAAFDEAEKIRRELGIRPTSRS